MGLPQLPTTEDESSVLVSYDSWLLKHPSALDTFNQMLSITRGKKIVVCLDYDGTLSNIVDNPEKAFMTDKMRMVLREVARHFPTAIISGRGREKVSDFVDLDNVYYAGSHGLDIAAPLRSPTYGDPKHQSRALDRKGNEVVLFQPAKKYLPAIEKILSTLNEKTRSIQGVMIENNKFCVSVHFRHVRDEDFCTLEKLVNSVLQEYEEFRISIGKKVFEIRPDMEWNKGHALNYFIDTLGLGSSNDVLPLYIGDDRTDEDAFKAIRNRGEGFPIVVSSSPKDTAALYSLRNPLEVNKFLINLVMWRKNSSSSKSLCQNLEGKTRKDWLLTPTSCAEQRTFDPLYSVGTRYWDCKT
ncbi:probable trehalose-phosphate phosphatase C [Rhododendron vialii]|uniref:probable trehalose-phosphate phosphatase C n=1 Tax=Rhododendron vialii TaxID=182163 RepID=UPI0026600BE8|nr:probable trehalose-phosphate phosphatase C [Rhododendron vialii]XP_058211522.1 probable trehalose-phosphate phosphatase C [Rhododendron vialii]XP_058211525.1 probable trehalose-phosphate phosphatase C [Rhododendron vialii]